MMQKIALILTYENIETNTPNKNLIDYKRNYLDELKLCIKSWRNNAGWLKDILILVHSDIDLDLGKNIKIIKKKFKKPLKSEYGFVNIYESGLIFNDLYPDYILLHIDLDMFCLRELPKFLFESILKCNTIIGVYSEEDESYQRKKLFGNYLAETDFILTYKSNFYQKYIETYPKIKKFLDITKPLKENTEYNIEEYVADYLMNINNIDFFERYEIGESFYNKIDKPFFIHSHDLGYCNEYFRSLCRVKNY